MKFQEGEIVRIKAGENDQGHGDKLGIILQVTPNLTGVVVADFPNDLIDLDDAEAYEVGFPPDERSKPGGWFSEDQLEGVKVFISHDARDAQLAQEVASALREAGFKDVWDDRLILPGDNWAEKISEALKESEVMIVLLTPEALESSIVNWEIGFALGKESYEKRLIPVIVGSPEKMPDDRIPWILRSLKVIKLPERGKNAESLKQIALALKEVA